MNEKYQQYYNKILTGTLTDTILKGVSYQANIQLANDIIADSEKTIKELKESSESLKKDLDALRANKTASENNRISNLENTVKNNLDTINNLNRQLSEMNKMKQEYENVKHQVVHLDTFRNDLVKSRQELKNLSDNHEKQILDLKKQYEDKIAKLNSDIENLKTPAKKTKKATTKVVAKKSAPIKTIEVEEIKDGGSF